MFAVNSISLVPFGADGFEKAVDHEIIFKGHAQLTSDPSFDHGFFHHAQHQHFRDSSAAIFFGYTQSDQSPLSNVPLMKQQFDQANWKPKPCEPTVEVT